MSFGIEILFITLATGSAYAVLMYVLKREVTKKSIRATALFTVAFALFALGTTNVGFMDTQSSLATSLLLIAILSGGFLVSKLGKAGEQLQAHEVDLAKNIGIVLFSVLTIHWLSTVYFLAF